MRKCFFYVCVWYVGLGLFACTESQQATDGVIDVASAMSSPSQLMGADYFRKVRYLPLETTDECLIGRNPQVQVFRDKILVTSSQGQCFLFDKETGRFLCSVGYIENDPEGYQSVSCLVDKETGDLYFPGWSSNWVVYDENGRFKRSMPKPVNGNGIAYAYAGKDTYIGYSAAQFSGAPDSLFFFTEEAVLDGFPTEKTHQSLFDLNEIMEISVIRSWDMMDQFGPTVLDGVVIIHFKDPDYGNVVMTGNTSLWHQGDRLLFKPAYNDTIYQVKDRQLTPVQHFHLGEYHWDYAERHRKDRDRSIVITQILDSDDMMLFRYVSRIFTESKAYTGIYSKRDGSVRLNLFSEGITDNITGFLPLQPYAVSEKGEYVGMLLAYDVAAWFEDHADGDLSPDIAALKSVGEEDNPVIVLMD